MGEDGDAEECDGEVYGAVSYSFLAGEADGGLGFSWGCVS